jgi:hypothetical protein
VHARGFALKSGHLILKREHFNGRPSRLAGIKGVMRQGGKGKAHPIKCFFELFAFFTIFNLRHFFSLLLTSTVAASYDKCQSVFSAET